MISGLMRLNGRIDHNLCQWLEELWESDGRSIGARAEEPNLLMLASSPDSPLWEFGEVDQNNSRGVFAARLPEMDAGQLVDGLCGGDAEQASLNGAYAFAFSKSGHLCLVRDQFGQVPIYWQRIGEQVLFSSVFTDFTRIPGHPHQVDDWGLELATGLGRPGLGDRSTLVGVRRAVPGALTEIGSDSHSVRALWNMDQVEVTHTLTFSDAVELMDGAISQSVDCCVDPSEAIGSHFSGGLDSTLVSYMAQSRLEEQGSSLSKLYSWTPGHDTPAADSESHTIRRLASRLQVPVSFGPVVEGDEIQNRDPATEPLQVLRREIYGLQDAQSSGISVLLSGWGGDDFASFGGRHYVENLFRRGEYRLAVRQGLAESRFSNGAHKPSLLRAIPSFARAALSTARRGYRANHETDRLKGRTLAGPSG